MSLHTRSQPAPPPMSSNSKLGGRVFASARFLHSRCLSSTSTAASLLHMPFTADTLTHTVQTSQFGIYNWGFAVSRGQHFCLLQLVQQCMHPLAPCSEQDWMQFCTPIKVQVQTEAGFTMSSVHSRVVRRCHAYITLYTMHVIEWASLPPEFHVKVSGCSFNTEAAL